MPINFIDGKCHPTYKAIENQENRKTYLTNHAGFLKSHHIIPLAIHAFGGRHTDTHIMIHEQKQFQETRHTSLWLVCAWFKNK